MAAHNNSTKRYIYLADDDRDDRDFFVDAIREIDPDFIVEQARDGMYLMESLLALSQRELPDFIFLDINMPRKSGLDCLQELRNNENLKEVSIIMLSTSSDPENIQMALELGATFYAVKPSSFEKLKFLLEEILSTDLVCISGEDRKFLLV